MSKHTPGPWETGVYVATDSFRAIPEHVAVMRQDGSLLAITGPAEDTASQADARLIAAAPELLAFAERVAEYFHYREDDERDPMAILADIEADARAAIAKAEGKL